MSEFVVDMIEELKLRRWARLNYRRLEKWDASLDPIVLDELQTIQREAQQAAAAKRERLAQLGQPATTIPVEAAVVEADCDQFGAGVLRQKSA